MSLILAVLLICVVSSTRDQRAAARLAMKPAERILAPAVALLVILLLLG